jgi:hypothetical protein
VRRLFLAAIFFLSAVSAWASAPPERTSVADLTALEASADPGRARLGKLLRESVGAYAEVRDYEAIFSKTEIEEGRMGAEEEIFIKFEKPFKIFLGWKNTRKKGLQVHYERGKHGNKLAIHKPGLLLGFAPVIFLEQSSPYVRVGSEAYDIEDAGIGTFLYDLAAAAAQGERENKLSVFFTDDNAVDLGFPGFSPDDGVYFASRIVARFDATTRLPVYMELYGRSGELTGTYVYENVALNPGSDTPAFKKEIDRRLYRVYSAKD